MEHEPCALGRSFLGSSRVLRLECYRSLVGPNGKLTLWPRRRSRTRSPRRSRPGCYPWSRGWAHTWRGTSRCRRCRCRWRGRSNRRRCRWIWSRSRGRSWRRCYRRCRCWCWRRCGRPSWHVELINFVVIGHVNASASHHAAVPFAVAGH